jgi:hypothetical protein
VCVCMCVCVCVLGWTRPQDMDVLRFGKGGLHPLLVLVAESSRNDHDQLQLNDQRRHDGAHWQRVAAAPTWWADLASRSPRPPPPAASTSHSEPQPQQQIQPQQQWQAEHDGDEDFMRVQHDLAQLPTRSPAERHVGPPGSQQPSASEDTLLEPNHSRPLLNRRDARAVRSSLTSSLAKLFSAFHSKSDARRAFHAIDLDGSGFIDATELHHAMVTAGVRISSAQVEQIIGQLDVDGDGSIGACTMQ